MPAAASVIRPRVASYRPYRPIRSPHSAFQVSDGTEKYPPEMRLLQGEPAGVERRRPQLCPELLDRRMGVVRKHVLEDADLAVVVERHVDVVLQNEAYRRPLAGRVAGGHPAGAGSRP